MLIQYLLRASSLIIARAKRELITERIQSIHYWKSHFDVLQILKYEVWCWSLHNECLQFICTTFWQCTAHWLCLTVHWHRDVVYSAIFGGNRQFCSEVVKITVWGFPIKIEKRHFLQNFDKYVLYQDMDVLKEILIDVARLWLIEGN